MTTEAPLRIGFDLPFAEAIKAATIRGAVLPETYYNDLQGISRQLAFSIAGIAAYDQLTAVRDSLAQAMATGQSFRAWKDGAAAQNLGLPDYRLENIWRTNLQGNYERGRAESILRHVDVMPYLMYSAIHDTRTRPSHAAMDGTIRRWDDPWWKTHSPPCGHQCVMPWTMVRGDFRIGLKSKYTGQAVEIKTRSGAVFSVTANHPVLSVDGWVKAHELRDGSYVLRHGIVGDTVTHGIVDNNNPPSRADDVFDSLSAQALGLAEISAFDFHGDSAIRDSDVYVAGSDGLLMYGVNPVSGQALKERDFVTANVGSSPGELSAGSLSNHGVTINASVSNYSFDVRTAALSITHYLRSAQGFFSRLKNKVFSLLSFCFTCDPSGRALTDDPVFRFLDIFPFNRLCFTCGPSFCASSGKRCFDSRSANAVFFGQGKLAGPIGVFSRYLRLLNLDFSFFKTRSDNFVHVSSGNLVDSKLSKQSIKNDLAESFPFEHFAYGFPGQVLIDQVSSVRYFEFSGHVYDFECKNGVILADGIITHNCRCSTVQLSERQALRRSQPGADGQPRGLNKQPTLPDGTPAQADPGFDYHPYEDRWQPIRQSLANRAAAPNASTVLGEALAGAIEGSLSALYSAWVADRGVEEAKVMWEKYFKGQELPR